MKSSRRWKACNPSITSSHQVLLPCVVTAVYAVGYPCESSLCPSTATYLLSALLLLCDFLCDCTTLLLQSIKDTCGIGAAEWMYAGTCHAHKDTHIKQIPQQLRGDNAHTPLLAPKTTKPTQQAHYTAQAPLCDSQPSLPCYVPLLPAHPLAAQCPWPAAHCG